MRAPLTVIDAITDCPQLTRVSAVIVVELTNAKGRIVGRQMLRDALEALIGVTFMRRHPLAGLAMASSGWVGP